MGASPGLESLVLAHQDVRPGPTPRGAPRLPRGPGRGCCAGHPASPPEEGAPAAALLALKSPPANTPGCTGAPGPPQALEITQPKALPPGTVTPGSTHTGSGALRGAPWAPPPNPLKSRWALCWPAEGRGAFERRYSPLRGLPGLVRWLLQPPGLSAACPADNLLTGGPPSGRPAPGPSADQPRPGKTSEGLLCTEARVTPGSLTQGEPHTPWVAPAPGPQPPAQRSDLARALLLLALHGGAAAAAATREA